MHVRQRQQLFMFYVRCVQHAHIIYYNIYTDNLVIKMCNTASLGENHSHGILFSSPWRWKEKGDGRTAFSALTGRGLSVFMKEDGLSFGFGPGSAGTSICRSTFLFSLLSNSFWWWSWDRTKSRRLGAQMILHHRLWQKERLDEERTSFVSSSAMESRGVEQRIYFAWDMDP